MPVGSSTPVSGSGDAKKPQGKPISVEYPPNSGRMWLVVTEKTDGDAEIKAMMLGILQQTYTAGGEDAFKQVKTIRATPIQENHQVTRIDIKTSGGESPISTTIEKTHEGIEGVFEGIASFFAPLAPVKTTRPAAPITLTTTSPEKLERNKRDALEVVVGQLAAIIRDKDGNKYERFNAILDPALLDLHVTKGQAGRNKFLKKIIDPEDLRRLMLTKVRKKIGKKFSNTLNAIIEPPQK